jgi:predicted pyridoxine 5'-phosphate oxidase superfamily flavin-nucleotide-binding protein
MQPTPYHPGELMVQQRAGEAAPASLNGRNVAPHVTAAARGFVSQQDLVLLGTADLHGRLWASLITGRPGFAAVSDDLGGVTLGIADPEHVLEHFPSLEELHENDPIALLFIELGTRRRLRVNGTLASVDLAAIRVQVAQSYAACPKYIQRRRPVEVGRDQSVVAASITEGLAALVAQIQRADTLFIASAGADGLLDVSHKGGRAGFAEWRDGVLHIPDYAGNRMFNTLGNLELDDRAGICIPDFEHSCQWMLTGRAQGLFAVAGTEDQTGGTLRWIEFHPAEWRCVPLNVAREWTLVDSSPFNP